MVLASILKERYREEGWEDGFAQGLGIAKGWQDGREEGFHDGVVEGFVRGWQEGWDEVNADWEAWYERCQQAARAGEPFDEPPPTWSGRPRTQETDTADPPSV